MTDQQQEDKIHKEELHEAILSNLAQPRADRRAQDGGSIAL